MESVGVDLLANLSGMEKHAIERTLNCWAEGTFMIPTSQEEARLDQALARCAVEIAVKRHAGTLEKNCTPMGEIFVQYGKDLTKLEAVIGIGGPLGNACEPFHVLEGSLFDKQEPSILKPKHPKFYIDERYIFYAMGLLSESNPELAVHLLKKYLKPLSKLELSDTPSQTAKITELFS